MSEETHEQVEEIAPDPIADKAREAGWKPLEEFEGDPDQWVDAKEFVGRAPLYDKNRKLKKEINDLKATIHEVKGHINKVSEAAYNKAMRELSEKRDEAIEMGDEDQVKVIDKAITEAAATKPTAEPHPAIKEWEAENGKWFYEDPEITAFGMALAQGHLQRNPEDYPGAMAAMDKALRKAYPDKYETPPDKRKDPPAVESGGKGNTKKTFTKSDLNDEQRQVMNRFVRQGVMSEEEYIKELADSGIIGGRK